MPNVDALLPEFAQRLTTEIDRLSNQQIEAMKRAVFMGMTHNEAEKYDRRGDRITELFKELSTITPRVPHEQKGKITDCSIPYTLRESCCGVVYSRR